MVSLGDFGIEVKEKKSKEILDEKLTIDIEKIKEDFKQEEIERFLPWFIKYKAKDLDDIIETEEIKIIKDFLKDFKKGRSILLHGAPGSGKTTTAHLIGKKYEYEIFEINASDSRNKKSIEESLGEVIKSKSLFAGKKLILVDEVDGVSGRDDRGGVLELIKTVKESPYPIIFTANEEESEKIKALKKIAKFINFENHSKKILKSIAEKIFSKEKIEFNKEKLEEFIEMRGTKDLRGFINDLQSSVINSKFLPENEMEIRDYKKKIETLLDAIFLSYPENSYKATQNSDVQIDDLFLYLEENIPIVEKNQISKSLAFNEISKADVFRGRIIKWQYWRYLVYEYFYLTYAISAIKSEPKKIEYKKNQRILKKWIYSNKMNSLRARTKNEKEKNTPNTFIERYAKTIACSAKKARTRDLPYLSFILKNNSKIETSLIENLGADENTIKAIKEL